MKKRVLLPGAMLLLMLLFGAREAHADSDPASADWRLVVASDPHYIAPALTDEGEYWQRVLAKGDSKFMPYGEEILSSFLEEVKQEKPDALLLTGDLTFNGAVMSHEALAGKLRLLQQEEGIPVLVLTGNHDLYNPNAALFEGESFTRVAFADSESFAEIYDEFGRGQAISRDPDSLSYMAEPIAGTRILMLDFNTLHDFCGISEKSLAWVEEQLRAAKEAGVGILAAGHQNLFQHTIFRESYVVSRGDELADLLRQYGVRLFLSGHLHVQHIRTENGLTEIATSSLVSYPCQYAIVESTDGSLRYRTRRLDMAAWAGRNGREEEIFGRFQEAAAEYMTEHFQAGGAVGPEGKWLEEMNLAYFSGEMRNVAALDPTGSLAQFWLKGNDMTALYVQSILTDAGKNFTAWSEEELHLY